MLASGLGSPRGRKRGGGGITWRWWYPESYRGRNHPQDQLDHRQVQKARFGSRSPCLDTMQCSVSPADMDFAEHRKRDRTTYNFARAARRLMKRCHQMSHRYDAEVYLLLRRKYRYHEYNSATDSGFPCSPSQVVRMTQLRPLLALYLHVAGKVVPCPDQANGCGFLRSQQRCV